MTTYRCRNIFGTSNSGSSASEVVGGEFDVIILFASWDSRCLAVTTCTDISSKYVITCFFSERNKSKLNERHDPVLQEFSQRIVKKSDEPNPQISVEGRSTDLLGVWRQIEDRFRNCANSIGRPLKVLVDLSASPRYYAMALLALGLREGLASEMTYFYAEGKYPKRQETVDENEMFTLGRWENVVVPGFEGRFDPEKTRLFVISLGWEGSKTLRAVNQAEPDRVAVLFPNPGILPDYPAITEDSNRELLDTYQIKEDSRVDAAAGDAIAAWKALDASKIDKLGTENVYFVSCGTKPHTLGLALQALAYGTPTLLYNKPDSHKEIDITCAGTFWAYSLTDLTATK